MSKLPAVQFYPGDWRKDVGVQSLNYHDRGVWFEMLMLMHESEIRGKLMLGGKAMSNEILASVLRIDLANLDVTVQTLIDRGVTERDRSGSLINRRMLRDEDERAKNREKLHGWRKSKKIKENGNEPVTPMYRLSSSSSSSSITKTKTTTPASGFVIPEWIDAEVWDAYLEIRRKRRAASTDRAFKAVVKQLDIFRGDGHNPNEILETSIRSSWTDVYAPKQNGGSNGTSNGRHFETKWERYNRQIDEQAEGLGFEEDRNAG